MSSRRTSTRHLVWFLSLASTWFSMTAAEETIGPCLDCAQKRPCIACPMEATCCSGSQCDSLRETGWTIFERDYVNCQVFKPYGSNEDCTGDPCPRATDPKEEPLPPPECDTSPIVVHLGCGQFDLTGRDAAVEFDIDADGVVDRISWIAAEGASALLVLDRDGDGRIRDGAELFGTATEQPGGVEPNGYAALGVFDELE